MGLQIIVETYSDYTVNEQPIRFHLDDTYEISSIEDRWQDPNRKYFKVRTTEGKRFLLRYGLQEHLWTLQDSFDGMGLLARPGINLIPVDGNVIREATRRIAGCGQCRGDEADQPFDWIIADVLEKSGSYEFILTEPAHCPNCRQAITEKTFIERQADGSGEVCLCGGSGFWHS
jgi:hypothetical protein